jgi:hypothetical protein
MMRASSTGGRTKGFVPVAVVTGFYGSGKTSLLHRLAAKLVAPSSSPLSIALLLHSLSEGTPPSLYPSLYPSLASISTISFHFLSSTKIPFPCSASFFHHLHHLVPPATYGGS